jgi:hypothetical protein
MKAAHAHRREERIESQNKGLNDATDKCATTRRSGSQFCVEACSESFSQGLEGPSSYPNGYRARGPSHPNDGPNPRGHPRLVVGAPSKILSPTRLEKYVGIEVRLGLG